METIYFAGGCFWGVEYHFQKEERVRSVVSGYMGGHVSSPQYEEVKTGLTGHAETIMVVYDPSKTEVKHLIQLFFEIHDFTQIGGQEPDLGNQYRSVIFYTTEKQHQISEEMKKFLINQGYPVITEIVQAEHFWVGESYHQNYYKRKGNEPYCHTRKSIF